jgi:hypothetical protein
MVVWDGGLPLLLTQGAAYYLYVSTSKDYGEQVDTNVTRDALMSKDPSKIKRCPECTSMVEASTMRPVARTSPNRVHFVCLTCFDREMHTPSAVTQGK